MLPHETTSIGRPMPRKLSVDSAVMALRMFITTMNEMDEKKFGARCCRRTWKKPPPMQREASTYSLLRSLRTSVRTTLAMLAQLVSPMTSESVSTFAVPRMPAAARRAAGFGHAQQNFGQPHQETVQPVRRAAADRAEQNGDGCGQQRGKNADGQRNAPAVPDHGENIAAHRVRPEEKFPQTALHCSAQGRDRSDRASGAPRRTGAEHDERQNGGRKNRLAAVPRRAGVPVLRATAAGRRPDESGRLSF